MRPCSQARWKRNVVHSTIALAVGMSLTGCDEALMTTILTSPPTTGPVPGPAVSQAPGPVAMPGLEPGCGIDDMGEVSPNVQRAPLELGDRLWVPTDTRAVNVDGARVAFATGKGSHMVFHRGRLGRAYTIRFTEPRPEAPAQLEIHWTFAPEVNGAYTNRLVLRGDDTVEVQSGQRIIRSIQASGRTRHWEIEVNGSASRVLLDGAEIASFADEAGAEAVPFVYVKGHADPRRSAVIQDLAVESLGVADRHVTVHQWALSASKADRFTLLLRDDMLDRVPASERNSLPALFERLEQVAGFPVAHVDPVVAGWNRTDGGMNDDWSFAPVADVGPSYVMAHEMAHWYRCGGGEFAGNDPLWLVEGFASFLGQQARHMLAGRPRWVFDAHRLPYPLPSDWQPGGRHDPPLSLRAPELNGSYGGEAAYRPAGYRKGHMFLHVLAGATSYEAVTRVIAGNQHVKPVTTESFLAALERESGRDLSHLKPGWLVPGHYDKLDPGHTADSDGDGLADFQELQLGLAPQEPDTDHNGRLDFTDRVENGVASSAGLWRFDGLPTDFLGCGGDVVTVDRPGNALGTWTQFALRRRGGTLEGAAWLASEAPKDLSYRIVGLHVTDGAGHRLKVTWAAEGDINELEWLDGYQGAALKRADFRLKSTSLGCEFVIPRHVLAAGQAQWTFFRGGWNPRNSQEWKSTDLHATITLL